MTGASDIASAALILATAENAAAAEIAALREHLAAAGEPPGLGPVLARLDDIGRVMAGQRKELEDAATLRLFYQWLEDGPERPRRHLERVK